MKTLKLISVALLVTAWLAGCHDDPPGLTTVPASLSGKMRAKVGTATISWQAPTTDTSGAALTNLGGYRIYYGLAAGELSESVTLNTVRMQSYVISDLGSGTWYFAVRAVTNTGVESALSEIVSKTIR